jgi:hypothetical protein
MTLTVARLAPACGARTRTRGRRALSLLLCACALAGFAASAPPASASEQVGVEQQTAPSPTPAAPGEAAPPGSTAPSTEPPGSLLLSNERTLTTWAHPLMHAPIYVHPDKRSRRIDHVRLETEDGLPEVYLLLEQRTDALAREWVRLRIPGRPNGRTGWVLREVLEEFHTTHWRLVISIRLRQLTAYYDGRVRFHAPVGVGKPSTPTPRGRFWIRERFRLADRSSPYWPYAIGTSDYSTLSEWPGGGVVGIHGDFGEPWRIPGDPSHGCVRMHAGDLAWLAPRLSLGTPVRIE